MRLKCLSPNDTTETKYASDIYKNAAANWLKSEKAMLKRLPF